jgi:hypothetical protein
MTSRKGVKSVLAKADKATKGEPTPEQIWVEYKKYLKSLKNKKTGELLWNEFGEGWTNRYESILKEEIPIEELKAMSTHGGSF